MKNSFWWKIELNKARVLWDRDKRQWRLSRVHLYPLCLVWGVESPVEEEEKEKVKGWYEFCIARVYCFCFLLAGVDFPIVRGCGRVFWKSSGESLIWNLRPVSLLKFMYMYECMYGYVLLHIRKPSRRGVPLSRCIWMYARAFVQPVFATKALLVCGPRISRWPVWDTFGVCTNHKVITHVPVNNPVATGRALLTFSHFEISQGLLFVVYLPSSLPNMESQYYFSTIITISTIRKLFDPELHQNPASRPNTLWKISGWPNIWLMPCNLELKTRFHKTMEDRADYNVLENHVT